jgi:hypothetical protein
VALVCGASVISGGITGVGDRYKQNNPRVMMNHCACHKSILSCSCGTHSGSVQQRMQETVRHLKKGIVTVPAGGPIFCIRRRPDFSMTVSAGGPIFL